MNSKLTLLVRIRSNSPEVIRIPVLLPLQNSNCPKPKNTLRLLLLFSSRLVASDDNTGGLSFSLSLSPPTSATGLTVTLPPRLLLSFVLSQGSFLSSSSLKYIWFSSCSFFQFCNQQPLLQVTTKKGKNRGCIYQFVWVSYHVYLLKCCFGFSNLLIFVSGLFIFF